MITKDKRLNLRMKESEYTIIKAKADALGVSVSDYLRTSALNRRVDGYSKLLNISDRDNGQIEGQTDIRDYLASLHVEDSQAAMFNEIVDGNTYALYNDKQTLDFAQK